MGRDGQRGVGRGVCVAGRDDAYRIRESTVCKVTLIAPARPLSSAVRGLPDAALAQKAKKLTYDQAWEECKKDVAFLGGEGTTTAGRYTRGAACMKQHGYRLKKSSM